MSTYCPRCGGEVQVTETIKRWWTLYPGDEPGTFEAVHYGDDDLPGLHVYCINDHEIEVDEDNLQQITAAIARAGDGMGNVVRPGYMTKRGGGWR